jgi:hypothetical protein
MARSARLRAAALAAHRGLQQLAAQRGVLSGASRGRDCRRASMAQTGSQSARDVLTRVDTRVRARLLLLRGRAQRQRERDQESTQRTCPSAPAGRLVGPASCATEDVHALALRAQLLAHAGLLGALDQQHQPMPMLNTW